MEKTKGTLILKQIEFEDIFKRKVGKNNPGSGKVSLPLRFIGQNVYVIILPEKE